MGDVRFGRYYATLQAAADPAAVLQNLPDEGVIAALAAASREREPYLANVLATEAMNRALRWEALFSSLGEGVAVIRPDGLVVDVNPAAEALLGWSAAEARSQPWHRLLGVDCPLTLAEQAPFLHGSVGDLPLRSDDETFHRKDGTPFQVAYVAAPLVREAETQGVVLVFRDVTQRRAIERRRREADQALVALARDPTLRERTLDEALRTITEVAARVLGVARVSLWRYDDAHARIRCIHLREEDRHGCATPDDISAADHPAYFAAIETERSLAAHDARTDPRTRELGAGYLVPFGITSMLDAPLRVEGRMVGIVCHEHKGPARRWSYDEEAFAAGIADLASLAIAADRRRRTEEALRKERVRLQKVVEHASVVLFALDDAGRFTLSVGKGLHALGFKPGEVVGTSVFDAYGHNLQVLEDARRALTGDTFTSRIREAGRVYETRWSPLGDDADAREGVVGVATDVTGETEAREALEASEERFAHLVDAIDGILWEGDAASLRHVLVSRHAESILGYPQRRWAEEPGFWIEHVHPGDRGQVISACAQRREEGASSVMEYRMITADGREVWLRDLVTVLGDGEGHAKAIGVMVDVTRLKAVEAVLAAHRDDLRERVETRTRELRDANEELEAFSRSVSHDLRGHLRGIDALSEALLEDEGPRLGEESRRSLERLRAESQRLAVLVESLFRFSLAMRGDVRRGRVDLSAMAKETARKLRERDPGRDVEVVVEEGVHATGDAGLLSLVVENLLENAWKYTSRTPHARIEVRTRAGPRGEHVVMVRDNGAGFDGSDAGLLFRPFQRLHGQAEFAGTGIGLATVRRIVERHGGHVWAEGETGRGATFSFVLPE